MIIAAEVGFLYAIMALGVYLTYRVLDFPDLTVDGSFTTGAAVATITLIAGAPPWLAMVAGFVSGLAAGAVTGLLHVWGSINPLLAGILTQIALYSINLRIMGKANLSLSRTETVFTPLKSAKLMGTLFSVGALMALVIVVAVALYWFLGTRYGVALRATGDNELMARSQGINTAQTKIVGLMLSNAMVAFCGSLVAQYQGSADISMGIGLIVAGLASVIVGQAIFGYTAVWQAVVAVVAGSLLYRGAIQLALTMDFAGFKLGANDMKLISAVLVVLALTLPKAAPFRRYRARRRRALAEAAAGKAG